MDSSFGLARSAESSRASLSAVFSESEIALASKAKDSEGIQHSGARLSARERTIVLLMGHGLSNKRIARQLSIAPETVKSHAKRIFWKLTVQTRAQAVYRASALGLL
jgi:ATP/maltotriose-dependent transcriptional regulator MalT